MADVLTIPVARRTPHFVQTTTLDGRAFRIRFSWNQRIARWFFSLDTRAGEAIVASKPLVLGADLLRTVRWNPESPQGVLVVVDSQGADVEATLDSLGDRHRVLYFTAD